MIAIVGDIKPDEAAKLCKKYLNGWKKENVPAIPSVSIPAIEHPSVVMVQQPVSQAYVAFGFLGPQRKDPDYQAARVMNYILGGGGFVSRITRTVRMHQGLAYDVYSYFDPRLDKGPYLFTVQTKCATADTAIKSMLHEMRQIQQEPVTDQELQEAKNFFKGSYPFRFETNEQIGGQLLLIELFGLGQDYFTRDQALTLAVTKESVQASAKRLLKPDNFTAGIATDTTQTPINLPGVKIEKQ